MIPRRSANVTACVRSLACSLARMFFTCVLAVSSLIDKSYAICLLDLPSGNEPQYFDLTVGQGCLADVSCNG